MEQTIYERRSERRVYTLASVAFGTALGGPLAATYFIAENFKALGQRERVLITWMVGVGITVVVLGIVIFSPAADKVPNQVFHLLYGAIAYVIVSRTQADKIAQYTAEGERKFSGWRVAGISLVWACITAIPILFFVYLTDPLFAASVKTYGQLKHEVHYRSTVLSDNEVDRMADALTKTMFFDNEFQNSILLQKQGNRYIISIALIEGAWNDDEAIRYYDFLRSELQALYTSGIIVINLCSDEDITNVKRVLDPTRTEKTQEL